MKILNKIILCGLAIVSPLAGCDTEELHDLNINPQALNEVNMNYLFTAAQLGSASGGSEGDNRYIDWRTNIGYCAYWMQHLAAAGSGGLVAGDKYFENVESDSAPWDFGYSGQLKNLAEVLRQTGPGGFEEGKRKNTREASRILRVFLFQRLTDFYGNIPYTEANAGLSGVFLPTYDTQETIYPALLQELEQAAAAISASNPDDGFAAADLMFQGDVSQWKKWANSLMLRMAMRMSDADATTAASYVTKALTTNGGVMTSNDDNVIVPMSETPSLWTNQNGISRAFISGDGGQIRILSKTLIDQLKGTDKASTADDDPRLMIYSEGINATVPITDPLLQEGLPNGLDAGTLDAYTGISNTNVNQTFSSLNVKFLDRSESYMIMNYAEVEFLQAEAKERGIGTVTGTAAEHYNAGVKAAMQMLTLYDASFDVSDPEVNAYLAIYPYTPGAEGLKQIGTQMWLSKFLNWWEAWSDWRRTGFPVLTEINYPGNITGGKIPSRLRYPTTEVAVNGTNMAAGGTGGGENVPTTKVWWDKN
jgi:hypothetical protein